MSLISKDALSVIFGYLPQKDLCHARQTCKDWNIEEFWKAICEQHLHDKPYQNSWKKRFEVIKSWNSKTPVETMQKQETCNLLDGKCVNITKDTLLENNHLYEELLEEETGDILIRNSSENKVHRINIQELGFSKFTATCFYDDSWYALDDRGSLFIFDLISGKKTKISSKEDEKINEAIIRVNKLEFILVYNKKIYLLDRETGKMKMKVEAPKEKILEINSTKNSVVYKTEGGVFSFGKKNPKERMVYSQGLKEIEFAVTEKHLAVTWKLPTSLLKAITNINVFEEDPTKKTFTQEKKYTIEVGEHSGLCHLKIHNNFLIVHFKNAVRVFDIRSGNSLANIKMKSKLIDILVNSQQVIAKRESTLLPKTNRLASYNFANSTTEKTVNPYDPLENNMDYMTPDMNPTGIDPSSNGCTIL